MNKWEKEVQQSLLQDEQRVLKVLRMAYADVLRETNDRMADLFARITADPTDSAAVYQFRYQQQIQEQLEKILDGFADGNYQTISKYLEKSYENGYLGAMYDIHKQGIPVVTPIQQEQVVRAVTLDSPISIPMYTRLGNNIVQLKAAITAEVTRGAVSGSMWRNVAARISDKGNVAAYNAMRIARTEGHRIQCAAQMDACRSAREAGADVVKQWDSTMDDRTRETHRQLHGQLRELDVPFEVNGMRAMQPGSFGRPEEDIHCRCALLQRARWALSESELQALRETDAAKELAGASGFEDFKGKYLKLTENPSPPIDFSPESGIIKAISIEDISSGDKNGIVQSDCRETIISTINRMKWEGAYFDYDEIRVLNIPQNSDGSTDVLRTNAIDRAGTPYVVLEINESVFKGRSKSDLNNLFLGAKNTTCNSLEDAVIHECGHAKTIYDRTYSNYERINEELKDDAFTRPIAGRADGKSLRDLAGEVSELAQKDGLECIAECCVKLSRGEAIPAELKEFYDKYTSGGG